ncbi:MAG TPA: DUF885 family protein [Bryobacteraceae bacterium]|nr:DUF885 family protein [Bryobacteraceae bacterium]
MTTNSHIAIALAAALLVICAIGCHRAPANQQSNKKQLDSLLAQEWDFEMQTNPETASLYGDTRYNSRLSDYSPERFRNDIARQRVFLRGFEAIDSSRLAAQDALSRTLMIGRLRDQLEEGRFKNWEMPLDQMNGLHLFYAELPGMLAFKTVRDYEDYLARLHQIPRVMEQLETDMRLGMEDRLTPPRYLLDKVAAQVRQIADGAGAKSPFAVPVAKFPAGIPAADRSRLRTEILRAIDTGVVPAYARLANFVKNDYAPRGRTEPGVWSLPEGDARYREATRHMTTTNLAPEQIHEIGLKQVDRIEAEMLALAKQQGFSNLAAFNAFIKSNEKLYAKSGDQLLQLYKTYIGQMRPEMPKLFGRQPKTPLEVVPMEAFRSKDAVPADYSPGSNSRPGRVNVNEYDPTHRLTLNVEAIAYHEGIPGHHQQLALAQELPDLPEFRKNADYTAFVEGWALYAERLGKEAGFYKDPYSEYGRLENEMWRAVRLVVDTGVHYKHWTRRQMVDYFHAHTAMDEPNIQTEVDRYIAWPGQALAYKLGQMKILELRERAKQALGSRFDLRAFHDAVLENGALPLDVLEIQIDAWIAREKKR